ncbi:MAG: glycosyltransferase family 2 protein, partial [Chloroflexota bacterium]
MGGSMPSPPWGAAPSVALVIPVLNEEAAIGWVVGRVPSDSVQEVIVVDGGSRDCTTERAAAAGARVIVERRRGYGRACATGAAQTRAEIVAFVDGDGADDPAALPDLLAPI